MNINELSKESLFAEFEAYLKSKYVELSNEAYGCNVRVYSPSIKSFYSDELEVGDEIHFELSSGEDVSALAIRDDGDTILFVFKDAYSEMHCMNEHNSNSEYDDMKKFLHYIYNKFPDNIRDRVIDRFDGQFLRLLTVSEVFGKNDDDYTYTSYETYVEQIPYFTKPSNRTCCVNLCNDDHSCWWWLVNSVRWSDVSFALVTGAGGPSYNCAWFKQGVRPAFSLLKMHPRND